MSAQLSGGDELGVSEAVRIADTVARAEPRSSLRMRAVLDGECPICFHRDQSAVGDRMQSEASRLVEWARDRIDPAKDYEVFQAMLALRDDIEKWTEIRRRA